MPREHDLDRRDPAWLALLPAMLVSGAVAAAVTAGMLRLGVPEVPPVASVRLAEITSEYTTRAAAEGRTTEDVRVWGEALEAALDYVAERRSVALLPARAVAAGAPDVTPEVEAVLEALLARRRSAGIATPPGDGR